MRRLGPVSDLRSQILDLRSSISDLKDCVGHTRRKRVRCNTVPPPLQCQGQCLVLYATSPEQGYRLEARVSAWYHQCLGPWVSLLPNLFGRSLHIPHSGNQVFCSLGLATRQSRPAATPPHRASCIPRYLMHSTLFSTTVRVLTPCRQAANFPHSSIRYYRLHQQQTVDSKLPASSFQHAYPRPNTHESNGRREIINIRAQQQVSGQRELVRPSSSRGIGHAYLCPSDASLQSHRPG